MQHSTYQDTSHCVHSAWVFMVGCPVEWDLAFYVGNPDVGVMLDEQLCMLWVVVVGTPMQSCLLQGREVLKRQAQYLTLLEHLLCNLFKGHQDTLSEPSQPTINSTPSLSYSSPQLQQKPLPPLYQGHTYQGTQNPR